MERPTLRQLEYVVALADTLNFRQAAERCFVTQPALSTQLQQLESQAGFRFFERDRRHVLITPAGNALVERARRVLAEADGFVETAESLGEPLTGVLRLGVIPTIAPYVLPKVLPPLRRRHPKLRLFLREAQTAELLASMGRGELDLLLLALEAELGDVRTLPLYRDPFVLIVPKGDPLESRKSVRESDLSEQEILLLEDGHCLRDQALSICELAGAREYGDFRASSLNTLVRMVGNGIGITLLPAMSVAAEVQRSDRLSVIPMVQRLPPRTIGLAWRPTSGRSADFQLLATLLREHPPSGVESLRRSTR